MYNNNLYYYDIIIVTGVCVYRYGLKADLIIYLSYC